MGSAKQQVELLLHKLPENCSLEDIQYHLYVLDKVRRGIEDTRAEDTISQEEAQKRLSKWLIVWASHRGLKPEQRKSLYRSVKTLRHPKSKFAAGFG